MNALAVARLLLPVLAAYLWIGGMRDMDRPGRRFLRLALALGAGIGIPSALFGASVMAFGPQGTVYAVLETALFAALAILPFLLGRGRAGIPAGPAGTDRAACGPSPRLLVAVFGGLALGGAALFLAATLRQPEGHWDAWAVWNLKARFLARGGPWWDQLFSPIIGWSNPGYPLLLPGAIARVWPGTAPGSPAIPALVAFLFAAGTVALLAAGAAALRGRATGLLAGILLLGTPQFLFQAPTQYADIPLAFFILASLVALSLHREDSPESRGRLFAAGLAAGCAAWTKNEGLLFAAAFGTGCLVEGVLRRRAGAALRETGAILAGALPLLALLVWFKVRWAPAESLFLGLDAETAGTRVLDGARHATVLGEIALRALRMGSPVVLGLLLLRARGAGTPGGAAYRGWTALAATGAGFYAIYVLTPYPLDWHVATSANRLLMQLWPGALFLAALRLGPADPASRPGHASGIVPAPAA